MALEPRLWICALDPILHAGAQRSDDDHRGHADEDPEHREQRAQLGAHDGAERDAETPTTGGSCRVRNGRRQLAQ